MIHSGKTLRDINSLVNVTFTKFLSKLCEREFPYTLSTLRWVCFSNLTKKYHFHILKHIFVLYISLQNWKKVPKIRIMTLCTYSRGEKSRWWLKKVLTKSTFRIEEERHKDMCYISYLLVVNKEGFGHSKNWFGFFIDCLIYFLWAFKLNFW